MRISVLLVMVAVLSCPFRATAQNSPEGWALAVSAALDQYSPTGIGQDWLDRKTIFDVLDITMDVPPQQHLHPFVFPDKAEFIGALHAIRLNKLIDGLDNDPPLPGGAGVRLYKMYSSGWVIATPQAKVGIDLCMGFFWVTGFPGHDQGMIDALADRLDAYLITHSHFDHYSAQLAAAMVLRGKPVHMPHDMHWGAVAMGLPLATLLNSPPTDSTLTIGDVTVTNFIGHQFGGFLDEEATIPDPNGPSVQNQCWLIDANGVGVLHVGDNNDIDFLPWLAGKLSAGWQVDVTLNLGRWHYNLLNMTQPGFTMQSHEWEFSHPYPAFKKLDQTNAFTSSKVVLFWGEYLDVIQ